MGAQLSVPMCHEVHEVELRGCTEAPRKASLPNPEEVGRQTQASVSHAHGPVIVSHHCNGRVEVLLVHRPDGALGGTEVEVALPAID